MSCCLEVIEDGRGGPEMFLVSFTKMTACFPYVFHIATELIASVSVNDVPFLVDVVFVLMCYQEFLNCVGTFKVNLDSCFAMYIPKTLTEAFGIWDYYKGVVVSAVVLFLCRFVLFYHCFWISWISILAWSLWNTQSGKLYLWSAVWMC